jgi:hypothetical protein
MDFSQASIVQNDFDVIPKKTLAFAILSIKPCPATGQPVTQSGSSQSQYLNCDLTIIGGQYDKRKIFTLIGRKDSDGSMGKWAQMGDAQIKAILESGRNASQANLNGYAISGYEDLNGLQVAIEIGVESDKKGQYEDKNTVAAFLSPNPDSSTHGKYQKLVAQGAAPQAAPVQQAPVAPMQQPVAQQPVMQQPVPAHHQDAGPSNWG